MTCPDIGTLQRFLDEGASASTDGVATHVAECEACVSQLRAMEERSERVRGWMEAHDPPTPETAFAPEPESTHGRRAWAAAAGIVLAVALVAGPARAWIRDALTSAPPAATAEPEPAPPNATTRFHVRDGRLTVRFTAAPPGLRLTVAAGSDSLAALEAPSQEGEIVVSPGSVEVREPPTAGTYRLTVPTGVNSIVLQRPGRPDTTIAVAVGIPVEVALGSRSP